MKPARVLGSALIVIVNDDLPRPTLSARGRNMLWKVRTSES